MSVKIVHLNVAVAVEDGDETPNILRTVAEAMRGTRAGIMDQPGVINFSARVSHVERATEVPTEVGSSRWSG